MTYPTGASTMIEFVTIQPEYPEVQMPWIETIEVSHTCALPEHMLIDAGLPF